MEKKLMLCAILLATSILFGCDKKDNEISAEEILSNGDNFYMAVSTNSIDVIDLFVKSGFDVNKKNKNGWTALSVAMRSSGAEDSTVEHLLELGPNPNLPDDDGETPLELAVLLGEDKKAISLLEHGALLQRSQGKEGTLIHQAIRSCNKEVIEKMLEYGGDKLLYTKGSTYPDYPVELAIDISGDIKINGKEVASMLLDHMDLNYKDESGNTLLHRACIRRNLKLIQMLLEKGMDVNVKNNDGLTPLEFMRKYDKTASKKKEQVETLLLSCGAEEGEKREEDNCEPPLITEQAFLDKLKQSGDLSKGDINQWTPLHQAADMEFENAVRYLLSKQVDVNALEENGFTPLDLAAMKGNVSIAKLLIEKGARLDVVDKFHDTPLDHAINPFKKTESKYELIKLLIDKGAPINGTEESDPSIFCAIGTGENKALKILIQNGADVNIFDRPGQTPLMQAIDSQNVEGFKILIMNGADINKKSKYGYSVIDLLNKKEDSVRQVFFEVLNQYSKK